MMPEVAAEALTSAEHVSVVWVLTPADCLSCAGQDIEIRDVMYDMAPGQIIAVTRGDSVARSTVRSFLIRRRIDVPVVALTADEWRTYWQAVPTPEILVYNNSRLEWAASQRGMSPFVFEGDRAGAQSMQRYISNNGEGCECSCYTGYCCDPVPYPCAEEE